MAGKIIEESLAINNVGIDGYIRVVSNDGFSYRMPVRTFVELCASAETIQGAVDAWLDEHPEAVTTVQDGSITEVKLSDDLQETLHTLIRSIGGPNAASTVAEMTDRNKIYVYTGSEEGYTTGNWYYFSNGTWVSGGVYNSTALETDTTLSVAGMAADAKATGDQITELKEDLNSITISNISDFDPSWVQGTISSTSGTNDDSAKNRCRTSVYYTFLHEKSIILVKEGYQLGGRIYDANDVYLSGIAFTTQIILTDNTKKYRFIIKKDDNGDITPSSLSDDSITITEYSATDKTLTLENKSADAKITGDKFKLVMSDNLMNNTLVPQAEALTKMPKIGNDGYVQLQRSDTQEAEHGIKIIANKKSIFGLEWSSNETTLDLAGLEAGETYTIAFDIELKLYNPSYSQIRYLMIYYQEGTGSITFPTIDQVNATTATSRKAIVTIPQELKDTIIKSHGEFTFTIGETAEKFILVVKGSSQTGLEYQIGDYIKLSNIILQKGEQTSEWKPSNYDIANLGNQLGIENIVSRNNPAQTELRLQQLNRKTRTGSDSYGNPPLCFIHFSDIHGDGACLKNVIDFKNEYSDYIVDILHTGDSVYYSSSDGMSFWNGVTGSDEILNVIGNHDARLNDQWTGLDMKECYDAYFAPYIENWGVEYTTDQTYYYKDYTNNKIRLIALDIMHQTAEQLSWFEDILDDAATNELDVIIAVHSRAHWLFDTHESVWDDKINSPSYSAGFSDTSDYSGTNYPSNLADDYARAVDSFIENGGVFVCWLHGHTHYRMLAQLSNYPEQLDIAVANAGGASYARTYVWERVAGTKSMDDFNVIGIDTTAKILRIMKIGVDCDRYMRIVNTMSYDYANRNIVFDK